MMKIARIVSRDIFALGLLLCLFPSPGAAQQMDRAGSYEGIDIGGLNRVGLPEKEEEPPPPPPPPPLPLPERKPVFTPFVTGIKAEPRNNLVRLSWADSPDATGSVYIYRAPAPFDDANSYTLIRPVEVPYGVQSYIDEVEDGGDWYYFIASSDAEGRRYDIMLPYNNTTSVTLEYPEAPEAVIPEPVEEPAPAPASRRRQVWDGITNLRAVVRGDGVEITFDISDSSKIPVLYRSVAPIASNRSILNAVIVQSGIGSPYMDYPVPGIAYYYALITEDELFSGDMEIRPGSNATRDPVEIPSGYRVGLKNSPGARSIPLPLISVNSVSGAGAENSAVTPLSPRAERDVSGVGPSPDFSKIPFKPPRAFRDDLEVPSGGGEEYMLKNIVQGPFLRREWEEACRNLTEFLSLPRSSSAESRARFYLGQSYYYSGRYHEALFEFLLVSGELPAEGNEWVQAVLAAMIQNPGAR
ncbi:MAG: hypothetical protein LBH15_00225 [Treponema sp.]|jgi:hypothetical protein|nr:hypothetical protein [Treponema sp.]